MSGPARVACSASRKRRNLGVATLPRPACHYRAPAGSRWRLARPWPTGVLA
jgi:hypothetical protein